jgi:glycosyltransferase involved in cell wall biosynthesis
VLRSRGGDAGDLRADESAYHESCFRGGGVRVCEKRRVLIVSHPSVLAVNQEVYGELADRGWDVTLIVPNRWHHGYSADEIVPVALPSLADAMRPVRVIMAGRQQRHFYVTNPFKWCTQVRPHVAFVEEEPFSVSAAQWRLALTRRDIPFGVACAENRDRKLPAPVRWSRSRVLADAAFVAARSPDAESLVRLWGAHGAVDWCPYAVPRWEPVLAPSGRPFTVGFAGRLVESKGLIDLLAAVRQLAAPVELILLGDGELRGRLDGQTIPGSTVRIIDTLTHEQMPSGYAQIDVLVLPSRTTPTWSEQFGRVIAEALWCGVPVLGSSSGSIPRMLELTGGGLVFPEGDADSLARQLTRLRGEPALRAQLAKIGHASARRLFSVAAATDPLERLLIGATQGVGWLVSPLTRDSER